MKQLTIGIVGAPLERHCIYLSEHLIKQGAKALILNNAPDIPFPLTMRDHEMYYEQEAIDTLDVLFMRALFLPTPAFDTQDIAEAMQESGQAAYAAGRERYATWLSYLKIAELQGKLVVNPIDSLLLHFAKPFQVESLRRKDFPVPDTLVTGDPDALLQFSEGRQIVYKPVAGGALCRLLTKEDKQPERLERLAAAPVQFQEYIPGKDLRVFVLDGRVIASFLIESDTIDFREGRQEVTAISIDPETAAMCVRACAELNLIFSGVDLKLTSDGAVILIECNPSPMFEGFDTKLADHETIVSQLAK